MDTSPEDEIGLVMDEGERLDAASGTGVDDSEDAGAAQPELKERTARTVRHGHRLIAASTPW